MDTAVNLLQRPPTCHTSPLDWLSLRWHLCACRSSTNCCWISLILSGRGITVAAGATPCDPPGVPPCVAAWWPGWPPLAAPDWEQNHYLKGDGFESGRVYCISLWIQNAHWTTDSQTQLEFSEYRAYKLMIPWRHVSACNLCHHQACRHKISSSKIHCANGIPCCVLKYWYIVLLIPVLYNIFIYTYCILMLCWVRPSYINRAYLIDFSFKFNQIKFCTLPMNWLTH
jgi:hypothetical protein